LNPTIKIPVFIDNPAADKRICKLAEFQNRNSSATDLFFTNQSVPIMNRAVFWTVIIFAFGNAAAQSAPQPTPTPVRVVITDKLPAKTPTPEKNLEAVKPPSEIKGAPSAAADDETSPAPTEARVPAAPIPANLDVRSLSFRELKSKIAEAKRSLVSRPVYTASTSSAVPIEYVRIAFNDRETDKIDFVTISKAAFLSVADETVTTSESGRPVRVRTIRANGVNTPVVIFDERGSAHLPLLVQYPVVRDGKYIETAFYMSTHPGLVTPETVSAGRLYVRNIIEIARERLADYGIEVSPRIADIAERLATVEHVDHYRFRTEPHSRIFDDIFTLYALNEGQTYRYSVSSAGAGGMVQMIPSTYRMVRSWHPNIPLIPDFVEGMRNHVNAAQAMLLYMNRTWNDLVSNPVVSEALAAGIATPEQLMAAGYNSNPARLPGYIKRGGALWTDLIPRETKIYLQIYDSLERNVPMVKRTR
jgi:hypothetical protein